MCRQVRFAKHAVYENFIRQIAGDRLVGNENTTLKESVEQQKQREQIEKQIAALETKMKKEKQLNRKMELKAEIKKLRQALVNAQNSKIER